ncbi:MAG: sugar phosphate isomerase/epimerase [Gemmatimonadota bacterium]|nr:sugar phosphate isomerase/epimerase [Gemmatimonadota bacterium]
MDLVFSPALCPDLQLPEILNLSRAAGYSCLELFRECTQSSPVHPQWSVPMFRSAVAEAGIRLSGFNIRNLTGRKADSDERNLAYNLRQLEWDIHMGRALGVKTLNTSGGDRTSAALADLVEGVNTILENVRDITLNLGNRKGNRLQGLGDYQAVMSELPERARVLLDTGHLLSAGESIMPFAEALAGRIGRVRLRDQAGDKPVPFGEGEAPFEELLNLLTDCGYGGPLVVELKGADWDEPLPAAISARRYVESLL